MAETRQIQPRERSDDSPDEPRAQVTTVQKEPREQVLDAFRRWGYLETRLDPLGRDESRRHPELALDPEELPGVEEGRRWYCGSLGVEFMHIPDPERRRWVAEAMEAELPAEDAERVFEQVLRAETFEQLLQSRYLGTKRFSIEGVAALIPLLAEMLDAVADRGGRQAVLAMSHRGRLNVMAHIVGTPAEALLAGFEDVDPRSVLGGGDVKYHLGATGPYRTSSGGELHIHLASNPSHLEAIDPVALGRVRAKQQRLRLAGEPGEQLVVPILLHGDAAFAGQGILAETLNLASLDGFSVGGTVHVVVNNRIGFTTEPEALHSGAFATDVARRLPIPIFHVNGEDLRAVVRVARLAVDYRSRFGDDVVVDLVGFRRHGHSEVDDPTITQPLLYKAIDAHPPLADLYGGRVGLSGDEIEERRQKIRDEMDAAQKAAAAMDKKPKIARLPAYWDDFHGGLYDPECEVDTGVASEELGRVAELLTRAPDGFHLHPKIAKLLEQRSEMGRGERPVDYGFAEALAFGTLLSEGVPVRLSGQDTRRGTFSHRHSVLIDIGDESEHLPLCALADQAGGGAFFEIYDSMLSEAAVLGFEFGFARDYPEALVGWEAQFGDFVNGAQVIIDQFLVAAEDKWGLLSGVVMLLPHGFEGQGPEHSSGRIERFLTLSAECNVQVCQPSTAAQYFHLLRRQALRMWRKPLVVFTPKSMLRHKASSSELAELSRPRFLEVVPDGTVSGAERVLVASGKIVHELEAERARREDTKTAIVAVEQLYPFPDEALAAAVDAHPDAKHIVWVQEEPANMGALRFVMPHLELHARGRRVRSVKRSASGSPATGSAKAHALEQKTLLTLPFEIR